MRINAKKYIEVICNHCGSKIQKELKEYTRQTNKRNFNFFCDLTCAAKTLRRDDLTPFRIFIESGKKHSKKRGYKYEITVEFLKSLWEQQKGICPYTGKQMILSERGKHHLTSASLDRIDSSKGYSESNVEFVCLFVNLGKNGFTKDQVKEFFGPCVNKGVDSALQADV